MNVEAYITEMISSIGENINLRRMTRFDSSNSYISTYIHGQVNEGLGKIGVMVNLKSDLEIDVFCLVVLEGFIVSLICQE